MRSFCLSIVFIFTLLVTSCGGRGEKSEALTGDTLTSRAELLTLIDCGDYVAAIVENPWKLGSRLAAYALVPRSAGSEIAIPDDFQRVDVPLKRSVVYSSTNISAIGELGELASVCGVADGNYYTPGDTVCRLIAEGIITDIGNSMSPKPETLIDISPDAVLISPYENAGHGVIDALKVPVIECADYMETTPLGRAEWLLFLGELYGKRDSAREIYDTVAADYENLRKKIVSEASDRPKVLTESLTSGVWYVPGGKSYMGRLLADAGADFAWSDNESTGSLQLDAAAVIDKASDADIWIMRNYGDVTLQALADMSPLYSGIKAYKNGEVYNCNTSVSPIFNDIAFHPERILADLASIFHPALFADYDRRYYNKVAK